MPTLTKPKRRTKRALDRQAVRGFVGPYRTGLRYTQPFFGGRSLAQWISSWVYVCADRNSTAVSQQVLRMYRRNGETPRKTKSVERKQRPYIQKAYPNRVTVNAVEVEDHPFLELIHYVNPILDRMDLIYLTVFHLQIHGSAYWHIHRDSMGIPREIWPLPPQCVGPILGETSVIDEFVFRLASEELTFPAKDVIYFRQPSPIDIISGLGNLRAILNTAELNLRMQEWTNAVMENYAVPDMLIVPKGNISAPQVTQFNEDWKNSFGGWRNRGKPAVAPMEMDVKVLSQTPKELEFKESRDFVLDQICAGFKVPRQIVCQTDITFNNAKQGKGLWLSDTIDPLCIKLAETLNAKMMPNYSDDPGLERSDWFVCFDNPVPEDVDAEAERAVKYVGAGVITINEVRTELGLSDIEDGDIPLIPSGVRRINEPLPGAASEAGILGLLSRGGEDGKPQAQIPKLSLSELTGALESAVNQNDLDAANLYRDQIASLFGMTLPSLTSIAPSSSVHVGMVEPDRAAAVPPEVLEAKPFSPVEQQLADAQVETAEAQAQAIREGGGTPGAGAGAGVGGGEDTDSRDKGKTDGASKASDWKDLHAGQRGVVVAKALDPGGIGILPSLSAALSQALAGAGRDALARLPELLGKFGVTKSHGPTLEEVVAALLKPEELEQSLILAAKQWIEAAFAVGEELGAESLRSQDKEPAGYLPPDRVLAEAEKLLRDFSSKVVAVQGEQLFEAIREGFASDANLDGFIARVYAIYGGERTDKNSERIARTELIRAMNAGAQANWVESGVVKNTWLASGACEFCEALDGRTVKIGEAFVKSGGVVRGIDGGHYVTNYGDVTGPPLHPHCTCTLLAVLED